MTTLQQRRPGLLRLFNPAYFGSVSQTTFDPEAWRAANAVVGSATGRGTTWFVRHGQHQLVLKHYRRGGLIGKMVEDRYLYTGFERTRAIAEYRLLAWMRDRQLPVPAPVAAQIVCQGLYYRADLITQRIAGAKDLSQILQQPLAPNQIRRIGAVIANFHRLGIHHADLNIHNILLDAQDRVWIIDFDRGRRRPPGGWCEQNLHRLHISFQKEVDRLGIHWQASDWQQLLQGYYQGESPTEPVEETGASHG